MKTIVLLAVIVAHLSIEAHAALESRIDGAAYYDTILDVTWLADANLALTERFGIPLHPGGVGSSIDDGIVFDGRMSRTVSLEFVHRMNEANYLGFSSWRLPAHSPVNGTTYEIQVSYDASTDQGYGTPGGWVDGDDNPQSELGHMYYVNLGNLAQCPPGVGAVCSSSEYQPGWGLVNSGPFINIENDAYQYRTALTAGSGGFGEFWFFSGFQETVDGTWAYVWPVLDGDPAAAAVPVPPSLLLFLSGIFMLARGRKHKLRGA